MYFKRLRDFTIIAAMVCVVGFASTAQAQNGGGGGGGGGAGGTDTPLPGGVQIDPGGLFKSNMRFDLSGNLDRQRLQAAKAKLNKDVQATSSLRKVSLNRLEAAYRKCKELGKPIPAEMQYLAGITRLTHVFFFPETKDIVIAGPAEGFFQSSQERVVGMNSGKAVLRLEDLVVALRAYAPEKRPTNVISCSIDPTKQGLVNLDSAVKEVQNRVSAVGFGSTSANEIASYFQQAMGLQTITVKGVSPKTHFAQVLVDADYHMKLIGIGLERAPVRITSFIEKAKAGSTNSLQRWYFQPNYECVKVNEDETGMQLSGGGVKLVGEDESVSAGVRKRSGKASRASRTFTASFTKMYEALADKMALYAQLRNVIDMSVAAAFIQEMDFYGQADWKMEYFGDESKVSVERFNAPTKVNAAINAVWKNGLLLTPIGGGVNIQPRIALMQDNMKVDETGEINKAKRSINVTDLQQDQWWWD